MDSVYDITNFMKSNFHVMFILAILYFLYTQSTSKGRGKITGG